MVRHIDVFLDWLYPPFRPFVSRRTFQYAACGGANTVFDIFLFFIAYNFIFQKQPVYVADLRISPHIAAFLLAFTITFPIGFSLNRYVVFRVSTLAGRIQLFRYSLTVLVSLILNYVLLKFFIEVLAWYPTFSKIVTTFIVIGFSYLSQSYFTFKVKSYR